jgi:2-hydroxy-3-oxopropionate reductase
MADPRPSVGFIGLGVMGRPMALNLLKAGYPLVVHSRSPEPVETLVAAGANSAASPATLAAQAEILVTMLPDTPDVELVLLGDDGAIGALREGALVVDMSTIDPIATRAIAERLAVRSVAMLDAPVSGGERGAVEGTLAIMVGGPAAAFDRARPLFDVLGRAVHVGEAGAGQLTKACNQLIVAATIETVAEALVLAAKAGVDPAKVREALLGGFASSRILDVHGNRMLARDFAPGFRSALHRKDARIIAETVARLGVSAPAFAAARQALECLVNGGGGDLDHSALVTVVETESGIASI